MRVVHKKVRINKSGKVKLDITTGLRNCMADVLLIIDKSDEEINTGIDFSDIAGKITFNEDPLMYQKSIRSEWK
jgi:hypothetical protein